MPPRERLAQEYVAKETRGFLGLGQERPASTPAISFTRDTRPAKGHTTSVLDSGLARDKPRQAQSGW